MRLRPGSALEWGVDAKRIASDFEIFVPKDTNHVNTVIPEQHVDDQVRTEKAGAYVSLKQILAPRLKAAGGLRLGYFDFNEEVDWSPRMPLTFDVDGLTSINAAWGLYHQNLPPSLLVQHPDNRALENPRAGHCILGLMRRLTPRTQLTVEAYRKDYSQLPYDPDDPIVSVVDAYVDFGSPVPGA